jgi:hypothetical protein
MNRMLRLLRMSKLAKLARMFKLFKYLEGAEAIIDPGSLQLFKLIFISLFSCHLFGCAWWLISDLELSGDLGLENDWYTEENKWQPANWLRQEPKLHIKYLHAFYWGAAMVTARLKRHIDGGTAHIDTPVSGITQSDHFGMCEPCRLRMPDSE